MTNGNKVILVLFKTQSLFIENSVLFKTPTSNIERKKIPFNQNETKLQQKFTCLILCRTEQEKELFSFTLQVIFYGIRQNTKIIFYNILKKVILSKNICIFSLTYQLKNIFNESPLQTMILLAFTGIRFKQTKLAYL